MAAVACHRFGSATQLGSTHALGADGSDAQVNHHTLPHAGRYRCFTCCGCGPLLVSNESTHLERSHMDTCGRTVRSARTCSCLGLHARQESHGEDLATDCNVPPWLGQRDRGCRSSLVGCRRTGVGSLDCTWRLTGHARRRRFAARLNPGAMWPCGHDAIPHTQDHPLPWLGWPHWSS